VPGHAEQELDAAFLTVRPTVRAVPFGIYVHVPFCASRCGYCAFTTYTTADLGGDRWRAGYPDAACHEVALARAALGADAPPVQTLFFGGGTPTLLTPDELGRIIAAVRAEFDVAPDLEVTVEANPDSVDRAALAALRAAGVTRMSFGMQSVRRHVLAVLERSHTPGAATRAARDAAAVGFEHVSLDLIYGTPGETDDDLLRSIDVAVGAGVDHVSAYSLIVEDGTALARRVRRGEVARPDDDVLAQRYELLDNRLSAAGLHWYEVSNWSVEGGECRHNLGYWGGGEWWGAGPGAHGFLGATRWWNVKHPNAYAQALAENRLPIADFEELEARDRHVEEVMLRVRVRAGLPVGLLDADERERAENLCAEGLLLRREDALVLTDRGRLLADAVVRDLLG
jgi:putative oxygen-independent coproporphyrinogen III oxidase